jgi:hypothetical protein
MNEMNETLTYRLKKRAEIRLSNTQRKSIQENAPDRISELLLEAASRINELEATVNCYIVVNNYLIKTIVKLREET